MKPFLLALFFGISTTLVAQEAFYFDPNTGSPAGGDAIRVTANSPSIDFRCAGCATPEVLFGGVASPRVTVSDTKTLSAVTPPHAEGVVHVELRVGGSSYSTFYNFGYARRRDPLLIPVAIEVPGGFGSRWTTDIWVYNDSDETTNLTLEVCGSLGAVFPCADRMIVAAHGALRIPPRTQSYGEYPEMILFPPTDVAGRLHFNVRVRDLAHPDTIGIEIPVARASDFRRGRLELVNVPVNARLRSLLRIYDQMNTLYAGVTVRAFDLQTGDLLAQRKLEQLLPTDGPSRTTLLLHSFLEAPEMRGHDSLRLEIEEADANASLWAMLTLTDNTTQQVTVLTSQ